MKRNKLLKRIFSSIIVLAVASATAIPLFALDTTDKVAIEFTNQMLYDMFQAGDVTAKLFLWSSVSMNINLYDMSDQSKSVIALPTSQSTFYDLDNCVMNTSTNIMFYTDLAYSQRIADGNLYQQVVIDFPFNYYIDDGSFTINMTYSGLSNDQNTSAMLRFRDSEGISFGNYNLTSARRTAYWNTYSSYSYWYYLYNWVPEGYDFSGSYPIKLCFSTFTFSGVSEDQLISSITFTENVSTVRGSGSASGYENFYCAPMVVSMTVNNTVYVDADIADSVEEYLDLITGEPSAAQEARLEELRQEFAESIDNITDAADSLSVPMPNLPGVNNLPSEVTNGMNEATEYAIAPIFSINIITVIVTATMIFAVLKLLLYGSGPS